jgi:nitrogen fixation/metabolism regulation signal transduction histidine kinase
MILIAFSIGVLGFVSYWNGYQLLLDNQRASQFDTVSTILYHLESEKPANTRTQKNLAEFYQKLTKPGLLIYDQHQVLVNHLPLSLDIEHIRQWVDTGISRGTFENEDEIITFGTEPDSGWTVVMVSAKQFLASELVDSQKYSILVAIISLILSMQATILIAHHLSRPIRQLADQCNQMSEGNLETKLEMERSDEIGTLADSFNHMIQRLQENTKKLLEAKQFNEDILRSLSTGVLVTDDEGTIINMNDAAERLLLPTLYEVNSSKLFSDLLKTQLCDSLSTQKSVDQFYVLQSIEFDERRYYATTAAPLRNALEQITGAILSFNDITERKRLELKMERVDRMASVGQLASGLAHEIRNPLAGMKTSIQVLKRRLVTLPEDRNMTLFDGVLHEIDRLNHLVSELLDFAKPRNPNPGKIDISEVVHRSVGLLLPAAAEKSIAIFFHPPEQKIIAFADENQVEQILINVLTNAIHASKPDDEIRILLNAAGSSDRLPVEILIEDQGSGIPEADLDKVFDPFYTTQANGTGLGLSVVHKLIMENGGEILIQSALDVGTSVKLRFPASL